MNQRLILILFITFFVAIAFFLFIPLQEWAGAILIPFSFILLLASKEFRQDRRLYFFASLSLLARQTVSLVNAYYTSIYGGELDAATFHRLAGEFALSLQPKWFDEFAALDAGSQFYAKSLGMFYKYLGHSLLLGQELSIIGHTISCLILIRMATYLGLSKWRRVIVLFYGLLPPSIIFASFTMREAWEILFFLLACYFALRLRMQPSNVKVLSIVVCGISLGMLHNGLTIYSVFLISLSLFWGLKFSLIRWSSKNILAKLLALILFAGVMYAWVNLANNIGGVSRALVAGEGTTYYGTYREKAEQGARANYDVKLDTSSIPLAFGTGFLAFIFYLFAPFPWQINSVTDFYAFSEGILRFFLLYYGFKLWWRTSGERKSKFGYLLICAISLEILFSFGTANWGTAIRHHIVAYGILLLLGGPGLVLSLRNVYRRVLRVRNRQSRRFIPRRLPVQGTRHAPLQLTLPPNITEPPAQ